MFKGTVKYDNYNDEKFAKKCAEMTSQEMLCNSIDNFIIKAYKMTNDYSLITVTLSVHFFITDTIISALSEEYDSLNVLSLREIEYISNKLYDTICWNCYNSKGRELIFNFLREIAHFDKNTIKAVYEDRKYYGDLQLLSKNKKVDEY